MVNVYVVVGSRGTVGRQIVQQLRLRGKHVVIIKATEILEGHAGKNVLDIPTMHEGGIINLRDIDVGLILAHRYRGLNIDQALRNEKCITRDFVWELSKLCKSLRVVVLGSITGKLVDIKMPESYHYSKDLQRSIVKQSIRISNLHMNLLELNWFEKYSGEDATAEYQEVMKQLRLRLGGDNLPSMVSITDFCCALIEMVHPPRGEGIVFDGGLSMYQNIY